MIIKIKRRKRENRRKAGRTIRGSRLVYARPSFLEGIARIFDFGGALNTYYLVSSDEDPKEADARAIASDWEAVGRDMAYAIGQYEKSTKMRATIRAKTRRR